MNTYQERLAKLRAIARENSVLPRVLRRGKEGNVTSPFLAAFYRARLPDLIAKGDALLPALESTDYHVRSAAEEKMDAIRRQIETLENPGAFLFVS
jgi:hypothetical protein